MKYESEIIHEILEQRGHELSSLHYQSECIETWIDETKGAYPKLCDYQSEWLNYMYENPIGDFPYEIITTNSTATINNVVPLAYKSAILKGQTLVNLINLENFASLPNMVYTYDLAVTNNTTYTVIATLRGSDKITTSKEIVFRIKANDVNGDDLIDTQQIMPDDISTIINLCQTIKITTQNNLHIRLYNALPKNLKIIILKGDHTQEVIRYFEGMQLVKMPVLTTTGKNLFNINDVEEGGTNWSDGTDSSSGMLRVKRDKLIAVKPNTSYVFNKNNWSVISYYDKNVESLGGYAHPTNTVFTTPANCYYLRFRNYKDYGSVEEAWEYLEDLQLEEGSVSTPYEPYKSNILTVNEDVTLRSNDDVYDELNLLTGCLTQRIDENNEVLAQAVVKTVELMITNQNGESISQIKPFEGTMNIKVTGTPIPPIATLEIPVEAITQNLQSFIEEE